MTQTRHARGDDTGGLRSGTTTFEALREQAVALRRQGLSRRQIRDHLHVHNNDILSRLLEGEPPSDWTRRPNAKDDLRARARELRLQGMTYDRIQLELGCSKSSISLWVRDLPKPDRTRTPQEASAIARRGWEQRLELREAERQQTKQDAAAQVGRLTERELFLIGVGLYWSEGQKSKPHARRERVMFVNSDPNMVKVFQAWLDLLKVARERIRYRVMIHTSGDVQGAEQYWADLLEVPASHFQPTTLKKHNPTTVRKNVGAGYRGCLVVSVLDSADLYRRIEGWWSQVAVEASRLNA
ncbi:hypothetical protein ACIO7M_28660 [Streptomyces toxytricini]|uniref:Uncharacterized protein n=1 Tax=Streptomyces toxytricini TaxID=67369 RepID=A0ABW8ESI8_STRT5